MFTTRLTTTIFYFGQLLQRTCPTCLLHWKVNFERIFIGILIILWFSIQWQLGNVNIYIPNASVFPY